MTGLVVVILLIIVIAFMAAMVNEGKKDELQQKLEATTRFDMGTYVAGLSSGDGSTIAECMVNESDLIFISTSGTELGNIPRNLINQVMVDNKSTISQRLTVTRMLALGFFSLAVPKKTAHPEFCLVIDWDGTNGIRQNTIFTFTGLVRNPKPTNQRPWFESIVKSKK